MKNYFPAALFLAASIAAAPAVPAYIANGGRVSAFESRDEGIGSEAHPAAEEVPEVSNEPYRVLDIASGEVLEVPVRDYVIGAVCAELPASFCDEAL